MKRIFTLSFLLSMTIALQAQTIETAQSSFLVKKTASWCPFCGQWGWTMMKGIMDDNQDKAIVIGAHYSGDLKTQAAEDLMDNLPGPGQPVFFDNTTNLRVNSGNVSAKRAAVKADVDSRFASTAKIGTGIRVEDKGAKLHIKVKTEVLEDVSGDYNVAVLILENDVQNGQSGRSGVQDHPNVLQEAVNGVFGDNFISGSALKGKTNDFDFDFTPNAKYNVNNLRFAVVVWKDNGGTYSFENGTVTDEIQISTSSEDYQADASFEVRPSVLYDQAQVLVDVRTPRDASIQVFDILGNEVLAIQKGRLGQGPQSFGINRSDIGSAGMYLVTLQYGNEKITKRLLVK